MNKRSWKPLYIALVVVLASAGPAAYADSTAFTYQGFLKSNGTGANVPHDFQFSVYEQLSGGTHVGEIITIEGVEVVNGLFTVVLNENNEFTSEFRYSGNDYWLQIDVKETTGTSYVALSPR